MAVSIAGIIVNIIMALIIIGLVIFGIVHNRELAICENTQSTFCYTIQCPCDVVQAGPCFGYAKMPAGDNQWYCSNAYLTKVNNAGVPV